MSGGQDAIDPVASAASFQLVDGLFTVRPAFDASGGTLSLVATPPTAAIRRAPDPTLGERARMLVRAGRHPGAACRLPGARRSTGLFGRRRRPQVLFASNLISEMSGNLKAVRDRMVERGLDRQYDLVTILRPRGGESRGFFGRVALARALARSDVILLDDSFPPLHWLRLGPKVRIIQMWHAAGAFKTVGYSRVGKPTEADRFARVHKDYDGRHRQLRPRRPILRRGVRDPGGADRSRPASRGWTSSSTSGRRQRDFWPPALRSRRPRAT